MEDDVQPKIPSRSIGKQYVNKAPEVGSSTEVPVSLEAAIAQSGMEMLNRRLGEEKEEAPLPRNGRAVSAIELYSLEAQWAFNGLPFNPDKPRQRGRPGWEAFRGKARFIILAASMKDDPYAIRTLLELDEQFRELIERHQTRIEQLEDLLRINDESTGTRPGQGLRIVEVSTARFTKQTIYITSSLNAYARVLADQISVFDRLVTLLLTARDCGLLSKKIVNQTTSEERRALGRIFETALRFRPSGITRTDVAQGLATVREAVEKFGPIPAGILDGSMSPRYVDITSVLDTEFLPEDVAIADEPEPSASTADTAGADAKDPGQSRSPRSRTTEAS